MKFYMTLGSGHPYYPGYFTCIADNELEARQITSQLLNNRWCSTYHSFDKVHPLDRIPRGMITKEYGLEVFNNKQILTEIEKNEI